MANLLSSMFFLIVLVSCTADTSSITSYGTSLEKANLSFPVYDDVSVTNENNSEIETQGGIEMVLKNVHGVLKRG